MKNLTNSQRELLTEKLVELVEDNAMFRNLIRQTNDDEEITLAHKESLTSLWDLDIKLNETRIDEIKVMLITDQM